MKIVFDGSGYVDDGVQASLEFLGNNGVPGLRTGDAKLTNYAHAYANLNILAGLDSHKDLQRRGYCRRF